jgi:hypothetical protein
VIETVSVVTYDEEKRGEPRVVKPAAAAGDGEGWLLIDDLVDTGTTARLVRGILPRAHFATVYAKPAGRPLVDTFITEVSQDTWILFPWDTEAQFVPRSRAAPPPRAGKGGTRSARGDEPPGVPAVLTATAIARRSARSEQTGANTP